MEEKIKKFTPMAIIASLTLGLAPFTPEPHIWKQIMNIYLGRPMAAIDWFDLLMHGAPWAVLLFFGGYYLKKMVLKKA